MKTSISSETNRGRKYERSHSINKIICIYGFIYLYFVALLTDRQVNYRVAALLKRINVDIYTLFKKITYFCSFNWCSTVNPGIMSLCGSILAKDGGPFSRVVGLHFSLSLS